MWIKNALWAVTSACLPACSFSNNWSVLNQIWRGIIVFYLHICKFVVEEKGHEGRRTDWHEGLILFSLLQHICEQVTWPCAQLSLKNWELVVKELRIRTIHISNRRMPQLKGRFSRIRVSCSFKPCLKISLPTWLQVPFYAMVLMFKSLIPSSVYSFFCLPTTFFFMLAHRKEGIGRQKLATGNAIIYFYEALVSVRTRKQEVHRLSGKLKRWLFLPTKIFMLKP